MSKYIIRNCPCRMESYEDDCFGHTGYYNCCACTDCAMKQIIEVCKQTCRKRCTNDCLGTKKHCGYGQILKLLDIQEVE